MSDFKLPESLAFKASEIRRWAHIDGVEDTYDCIARHCNAILRGRLAKLETVYGAKTCIMTEEFGEFIYAHKRERYDTHATKILPPWELEK